MDKSVKILTDYDLCYQCGTCSSICPTSAITMERKVDRGLIYPKVSSETCINCSKCLRVCPINNIDLTEKHLPTEEDFIGIFSSKDEKRFGYTASGGLVTEVLKFLFEEKIINKAIVTGMDTESPTNGKAYIIDSTEKLKDISGSVYQPVAVNELLKNIDTNDKVAFVGLPCHVRGLDRFLTLNKKLMSSFIFKIGIICSIGRGKHGTTITLERDFKVKDESKISNMIYRYGTPPGETTVIFKDETERKISCYSFYKNTDYIYMPKGCLFCTDLFNDKADITVGDPWGMKKGKKAMAIVRNPEVKKLLDIMVEKDLISFDQRITPEECIKTQQHSVNYKILNYNKRVTVYKKLGIKVPNYHNFENDKVNGIEVLGFGSLLINSRLFNTKTGLLIMKKVPRKVVYKYRDRVLKFNTSKRG